ncbi:DUF4296 domain-containing protein [candidate division KSB1 bacterium]|nr:DUF4296 domain-containing protein [candidate division KSB1 bacterium]MBL7092804.1 DUF4296 domain-containing protein [candidate division KSB1 bacterium]
MKKILISIIGIYILSQLCVCQKNTEPQKISEKKFVQIYCDVACYSDIIESKSRRAFVDSIFDHYDITSESFNFTKDSFSNDPQKWKDLFEKIVEELEKRKSELQPKIETKKEKSVQHKNEA